MVDAPFMTEVAPPILIKDGPLFLGTCPDAGIPPAVTPVSACSIATPAI